MANVNQVNEAKKFWEENFSHFELFTSGSTGAPKKISFSREEIIRSANLTISAFNLKKEDQFLLCLDASMVAGFMMVIRALVNGSELIITEPVANPLNELPADMQPDFMAVVPLQLETMLSSGFAVRKKLRKTKTIIVGGAVVSDDLEHMVKLIQLNAWHTYGMTETLTHVAIRKIGFEKYFTPLKGVKINLDSRGCLVIETPVLQNREIVTNDIAEITPEGKFRILGRIDNIINSGGYKVQGEKVEKALLEVLPKVHNATSAEVIVIASPHKQLGWQVNAVIAMDEEIKEEELRQLLREKLHPYEIPKKFTRTDIMPRNKSGKIDRHAIAKFILQNEQG